MVARHVRLYIEGGGEGKEADRNFRRGWKKFLRELHDLATGHGFHSLEVVRGKSRTNAFHSFERHQQEHPHDLCALLVDSECAVPDNAKPWDIVGWQRPSWASENQLYLMVFMVETWLLSDLDALQKFFKRLDLRQLPTTDLEARPKQEIEKALKKATKASSKGPYRHGQAHEILEIMNPDKVKNLRHGQRLFDGLRQLIASKGN